MAKTKPKAGRPTAYTEELGKEICEMISSTSMGIRAICKHFKVTPSMVFRWKEENPKFREQYTRAKDDQADFMAEEIHDVADEGLKLAKRGISPFRLSGYMAAVKVKMDALKWTAAKLKPKKYGDKVDVTSKNKRIFANVEWLGGKKKDPDNA